MSSLKCWTGSMVMLLALGQAVYADASDGSAKDPGAELGFNLTSLLGQEKAGLGAVEAGRMDEILAAPVKVSARRSAGAKIILSYDAGWIRTIPAAQETKESNCLARAVYFESRGESIKGQAAVAEVVMNRVDDPAFPKTICGVVQQSNAQGCQFSFTCDGHSDVIADRDAWYVARQIASAYMKGTPRSLTGGATYFHTPATRPDWSRRFDLTTRIGSHFFYRRPVQTAMN